MNKEITHVEGCTCIAVMSENPNGEPIFHEYKMVCRLCYDVNAVKK